MTISNFEGKMLDESFNLMEETL